MTYKTLELKDGGVIEINYNTSPQNPREWNNASTVAVFHKRYDFGDEVDFTADQFNNWDEMKSYIRKTYRPLAILPIFMYDHSGITINTTGFSCSWDSGQIGFIYTTQKHLDTMGITIKNDESWVQFIERLEGYLQSDIKILDQYINGEVFGFIIKDSEGERVDSCWGFYGSDFKNNGILDYLDCDQIKNLDDL